MDRGKRDPLARLARLHQVTVAARVAELQDAHSAFVRSYERLQMFETRLSDATALAPEGPDGLVDYGVAEAADAALIQLRLQVTAARQHVLSTSTAVETQRKRVEQARAQQRMAEEMARQRAAQAELLVQQKETLELEETYRSRPRSYLV
jgi:hypothetical protein